MSSCVTRFFFETCRSSVTIFQLLRNWLVIVQSLFVFAITNCLKKTYALSLLLFRSASEYVIRSIQVNQYGLKLTVKHQILVYADVNILGGSLHTVKKNP